MTRQREDATDRLTVPAGAGWVTEDLRTAATQRLIRTGNADLLPVLGLAADPDDGPRCPGCRQPLADGRTGCNRSQCIARAER